MLEEPMVHALRFVAQVQVRGKTQKVGVFEVFEVDPPAQKQVKLATQSMFELAVIRYYQGAIGEAKLLFDRCLEKNPGDTAAQIYWERCA